MHNSINCYESIKINYFDYCYIHKSGEIIKFHFTIFIRWNLNQIYFSIFLFNINSIKFTNPILLNYCN